MHDYKHTVGSRAEVFHGTAKHTSGGLEKSDLLKNKWGRIVSAKKHKTAKKEKRLQKAGYFAKKGEFGVVKRKTMRKRKNGKKIKGGQMNDYYANGNNGNNGNYGPLDVDDRI